MFAPELLSPWQDKLPNEIFHFPVRDIGPPSWVERQRVQRAFWRIQVFFDIRHALDGKRVVWDSSDVAEPLSGKGEVWGAADLYDVPAYIFSNDGKEDVLMFLSSKRTLR